MINNVYLYLGFDKWSLARNVDLMGVKKNSRGRSGSSNTTTRVGFSYRNIFDKNCNFLELPIWSSIHN